MNNNQQIGSSYSQNSSIVNKEQQPQQQEQLKIFHYKQGIKDSQDRIQASPRQISNSNIAQNSISKYKFDGKSGQKNLNNGKIINRSLSPIIDSKNQREGSSNSLQHNVSAHLLRPIIPRSKQSLEKIQQQIEKRKSILGDLKQFINPSTNEKKNYINLKNNALPKLHLSGKDNDLNEMRKQLEKKLSKINNTSNNSTKLKNDLSQLLDIGIFNQLNSEYNIKYSLKNSKNNINELSQDDYQILDYREEQFKGGAINQQSSILLDNSTIKKKKNILESDNQNSFINQSERSAAFQKKSNAQKNMYVQLYHFLDLYKKVAFKIKSGNQLINNNNSINNSNILFQINNSKDANYQESPQNDLGDQEQQSQQQQMIDQLLNNPTFSSKYLLLEQIIELLSTDQGVFQEAHNIICHELKKILICKDDKVYTMLQEVLKLSQQLNQRQKNISYYDIAKLLLSSFDEFKSRYQVQMSKLQHDTTTLQEENELLRTQVTDLKNQMNDKQQEWDLQQQSDLSSMDKEQLEVLNQRSKLMAEIKYGQERMKLMKRDYEDEIEKQKNDMKGILKSYLFQIDQLKDQVNFLQNDNNKKKDQIDQLTRQLETSVIVLKVNKEKQIINDEVVSKMTNQLKSLQQMVGVQWEDLTPRPDMKSLVFQLGFKINWESLGQVSTQEKINFICKKLEEIRSKKIKQISKNNRKLSNMSSHSNNDAEELQQQSQQQQEGKNDPLHLDKLFKYIPQKLEYRRSFMI